MAARRGFPDQSRLQTRRGGRVALRRGAEPSADPLSARPRGLRGQFVPRPGAHENSLFALLDDPQYESLFTGDEVEALRRRVPWTRVLREGFTTYGDRRVDLIDFVAGRREDLILKPNGEHGGRGATLGWQCDDDEWGRAINDRLGASFIVQERVGARQEPFPKLSGGQITYEDATSISLLTRGSATMSKAPGSSSPRQCR